MSAEQIIVPAMGSRQQPQETLLRLSSALDPVSVSSWNPVGWLAGSVTVRFPPAPQINAPAWVRCVSWYVGVEFWGSALYQHISLKTNGLKGELKGVFLKATGVLIGSSG